MAELIALSPFEGLGLPVALGAATLEPADPKTIHSVAPFLGRDKAVAKALKPLGLGFPAAGAITTAKTGAQLVWSGRNQAFLFGAIPPPALSDCAAVTDQSDGWAILRLSGTDAVTVLARLVPLDIRTASFPVGRSARSMLNHLPLLILRDGEAVFTLLVFRSMATTAVHELTEAMRSVAARAG